VVINYNDKREGNSDDLKLAALYAVNLTNINSDRSCQQSEKGERGTTSMTIEGK
jgi:hypothetical protein